MLIPQELQLSRYTLGALSDNLGDIPFQILHSYNRSLITQK